MVALGLLLLVLAVALTLGIVLFNGESSGAEAFGVTLSNVSIGGLFLVGVITGVVGAIGLGLMLGGAARRRAKRQAAKRQVRDARGEAETLAQENARLHQELEQRKAAPADAYPSDVTGSGRTMPMASGPAGSGDAGRAEQGSRRLDGTR